MIDEKEEDKYTIGSVHTENGERSIFSIELSSKDFNRARKRLDDFYPESKDITTYDVVVKLQDEKKTFTLEEFFSRLGFELK